MRCTNTSVLEVNKVQEEVRRKFGVVRVQHQKLHRCAIHGYDPEALVGNSPRAVAGRLAALKSPIILLCAVCGLDQGAKQRITLVKLAARFGSLVLGLDRFCVSTTIVYYVPFNFPILFYHTVFPY